MKYKSLIVLILQLLCLPAIANDSVEKIKKQYVNYLNKCSNLMENNPKKARSYCIKAIEVGDIPEIEKNITNPYFLKSYITLMLTDELKKDGQNKTIFKSTYEDLTKVIDSNYNNSDQKSQASYLRLITEFKYYKYHKNKLLGNNLCSDMRRGLSNKSSRPVTQLVMKIELHKKILKKECT